MSDMKKLIASFPEQIQEAISIGEKASLKSPSKPINNVYISGLGGSGIGGTIISELTIKEATVPVNVGKGYFIPNYINQNSLVIISSYSGDTEETVNALKLAIEKQAHIVCVSSGGKVTAIAEKEGIDLVKIPGGNPPRACLGYSLTQLFFILNAYGVISSEFKSKLLNGIELLKSEEEKIKAEANNIATKLTGKVPVIYGTTYTEGLAIRFRQQINENAKMLCWHHVFPELNHNELVGWTRKAEELAVVILRNEEDYNRNQARIEISKEEFKKHTSTIIEIFSKGKSEIERALYIIHLTDWISWYLSEKNGVDAVEIRVINHLKSELSKIN